MQLITHHVKAFQVDFFFHFVIIYPYPSLATFLLTPDWSLRDKHIFIKIYSLSVCLRLSSFFNYGNRNTHFRSSYCVPARQCAKFPIPYFSISHNSSSSNMTDNLLFHYFIIYHLSLLPSHPSLPKKVRAQSEMFVLFPDLSQEIRTMPGHIRYSKNICWMNTSSHNHEIASIIFILWLGKLRPRNIK